MASFIFDANKETPESLKRRRELAEALLARALNRPAQNVGEGLSQLGQALAYRISMNRADAAEAANTARSGDLFRAAVRAPSEPSATPAVIPANVSDDEAAIRTVVGEAGNQSLEGKAAAAAVILNRAKNGGYGGTTIRDVVMAPKQFEANSRGLANADPNSRAYKEAAQAVAMVRGGYDPTGGALNFINPNLQRAMGRSMPKWAQRPGQRIGDHVFFGGDPSYINTANFGSGRRQLLIEKMLGRKPEATGGSSEIEPQREPYTPTPRRQLLIERMLGRRPAETTITPTELPEANVSRGGKGDQEPLAGPIPEGFGRPLPSAPLTRSMSVGQPLPAFRGPPMGAVAPSVLPRELPEANVARTSKADRLPVAPPVSRGSQLPVAAALAAGGTTPGELLSGPPRRFGQENPAEFVTVEGGDTLWSIARQKLGQGSRWREIAAMNPQIRDPNRITPGMSVRVPIERTLPRETGDPVPTPRPKPADAEFYSTAYPAVRPFGGGTDVPPEKVKEIRATIDGSYPVVRQWIMGNLGKIRDYINGGTIAEDAPYGLKLMADQFPNETKAVALSYLGPAPAAVPAPSVSTPAPAPVQTQNLNGGFLADHDPSLLEAAGGSESAPAPSPAPAAPAPAPASPAASVPRPEPLQSYGDRGETYYGGGMGGAYFGGVGGQGPTGARTAPVAPQGAPVPPAGSTTPLQPSVGPANPQREALLSFITDPSFAYAPKGMQTYALKALGNVTGQEAEEYGLVPQYGTDENGKPVLIQISKSGKAKRTQLPPGVTLSNKVEKLDAGTHWALVDPVTRQIVSVIPKENYKEGFDRAQGTAEGKAAGEAKAEAPGAVVKGENALKIIDDLIADPDISLGLGPIMGNAPAIGGAQARVVGRMMQLQGVVFLEAYQELKGGGQITEVEGAKAEAAKARLVRAQKPEDYIAALKELREVIAAGVARARQKAGMKPAPMEVTIGKPTKEQIIEELRRRGEM